MPQVLIVVSDQHVNSTLGLWPPDVIDSEGTPRPQNKFQGWLWECWLDFCHWTKQFENAIIVDNGDILHGIHPTKDSQIVTTNPAVMHEAAIKVLEPLLESKSALYFVKGTEWHDNIGGSDLEMLAAHFDAVQSPHTGMRSVLGFATRSRREALLFHASHLRDDVSAHCNDERVESDGAGTCDERYAAVRHAGAKPRASIR